MTESYEDVQRLKDRLDRDIASGLRDFALACIEFDRLERIRIWHGADVGDAVDATLMERIATASWDPGLLARVSTSVCFVAVPADTSSPETLADIAWSLVESVSAPINHLTEESISVGATVGIAHPSSLGVYTADSLVDAATVASHRASVRGSRRIGIFENLSGMFGPTSELDRSLSTAIAGGKIGPWFQPKVRLSDGHIIGAEALARWDHRKLGVLSPAAFIPEAEWSGIIRLVDLAIIEQAASHGAGWPGDLHVAVNFSAASLDHPHIAQIVLAALERGGLHPQRAVIEVTETSLAQNRRAAMLNLAELRASGMTASLDDFGTGHAFFDALREGLFEEVKIDRTLLSRQADENDPFLTAVVELAASVQARTVAEGIETVDELRRAIAAGCDVAQGHLFGRPMPPQAFSEFLANNPPSVDLATLMDAD